MNASSQEQQIQDKEAGIQKKKQGRFIVFEGSDGTGKSTQLALLHKKLHSQGYSVLATREPSDGHIGKEIRHLFYNRQSISPKEELQLFLDDRRDHLQKTILPALAANMIVLCDRYFLSTVAYQNIATNFSVEKLLEMNSFAPAPDLALLLYAPLNICLQRITQARGEKPNDFEQQKHLKEVINIFTHLDFPWLQQIDSSENSNEVAQKIATAVQPILPQLTLPS